jgi:hypothetical protein
VAPCHRGGEQRLRTRARRGHDHAADAVVRGGAHGSRSAARSTLRPPSRLPRTTGPGSPTITSSGRRSACVRATLPLATEEAAAAHRPAQGAPHRHEHLVLDHRQPAAAGSSERYSDQRSPSRSVPRSIASSNVTGPTSRSTRRNGFQASATTAPSNPSSRLALRRPARCPTRRRAARRHDHERGSAPCAAHPPGAAHALTIATRAARDRCPRCEPDGPLAARRLTAGARRWRSPPRAR